MAAKKKGAKKSAKPEPTCKGCGKPMSKCGCGPSYGKKR